MCTLRSGGRSWTIESGEWSDGRRPGMVEYNYNYKYQKYTGNMNNSHV